MKSAKQMEPAKVIENPRQPDKDGHMVKMNQVKSQWRAANTGESLKSWARRVRPENEDVRRWFKNKGANTRKPQLGIGSTRKKKGGSGPKNPSGK
jgi:hypothetical protein